MWLLPAPRAPLFISVDPFNDNRIDAKVGCQGQVNNLSIKEVIVLAAVRCGKLPH